LSGCRGPAEFCKAQREERRQEVVSLEAISSDLDIGIEEFRLCEECADAPTATRRLRVPREDWPTDPEFQNLLIAYAQSLYVARGYAIIGQDRVRDLQSRISDHIEAIR